MSRPDLISPEHQARYRDHYERIGVRELRPNAWLPRIEALAHDIGADSIIDYGCGYGRSIEHFCPIPTYNYDPAIPAYAEIPPPADLVVSIHMLEHVEPNRVYRVIEHMLSLANKAALIVVSCEPSTKVLPDGSPWHSFVRDHMWWHKVFIEGEPQATLKDSTLEFATVIRK